MALPRLVPARKFLQSLKLHLRAIRSAMKLALFIKLLVLLLRLSLTVPVLPHVVVRLVLNIEEGSRKLLKLRGWRGLMLSV
jgi:hypothetical protein